MAAALDRRGSDLLTFRAKRLPIKTAQINRARESTHDAVCCGLVSPGIDTFETCRRTLKMSANRGRVKVSGAQSEGAKICIAAKVERR